MVDLNPARRLVELIGRDRRVVVGAMSGTSADGVDVVVVELDGHGRGIRWRVITQGVVPYDPEFRRAVLRTSEGGSCRDVCVLNFAVGHYFARAIAEVLEVGGVGVGEVDAVGSHGQTIYHMPEYVRVGGVRTRCTLQVGHPAVIAEDLGLPVVGDFRVRDVAAGGHGAPIIAYVDWALLSDERVGRLVQNIGGIANVTVLPPGAGLGDVYAFDTGPGNMVIDEAMRLLYGLDYDEGGSTASQGSPDGRLLEELMRHPFVRAPPPKTASRREFGRRFVEGVVRRGLSLGLRREDVVATLATFVVRSIVYNYDRYILRRYRGRISEVVLGGGGARNRYLVRELERELRERGLRLTTHEELGIDSKYKEALGMAVLAHETLSGVPNNVPGATGARRQVVMGVVAL